MRESTIERTLVNSVRLAGGLCLKWVCPGHRGVPDRICILPGGRVVFIELKAPGKRVDETGLQGYWRRVLREMGCECLEISTPDTVDEFIQSVILPQVRNYTARINSKPGGRSGPNA